MSRETELAKNTMIIGFGTLFPKLASIITLPIITAQLTKYDLGTYELVSTIIALLLPVVTMQIQSAAFRFLIEYDLDITSKKTVISTLLIFVNAVSLISILIVYAILKYSFTIKLLICIYFYLQSLLVVLQQVSRGLHNNKVYSLSTIIVAFINLIFIIVTVQALDMGLSGVLFSIAVSTLIAIAVSFCKLKIWNYFSFKLFSLSMLGKMVRYSWPMIPNSLSNWIMNMSDRVIVTAALGVEANAVYSIANKIPNLFTSVQGTFVMAWQENASIASKDSDISNYYSKIFKHVTSLLFSILAFLIALTPLLFNILIKGNYEDAYGQMPILFLGMFFSAVASFMGGVYVACKETKSIGITTISSAIINLLICAVMINPFGLYAGSISTLISFCFLAFFRMVNIQKYVTIKFDYRYLFIIIAILAMMCVCLSKNSLVFNIINLNIAIVFSCLFNKNLIKQLLSYIHQRN